MKNFEHAAEVLTALMDERDLTAAEPIFPLLRECSAA